MITVQFHAGCVLSDGDLIMNFVAFKRCLAFSGVPLDGKRRRKHPSIDCLISLCLGTFR